MANRVFVRFINENQWVNLCSKGAQDEPLPISDELFVEWCWADIDGHLSEPSIVAFAEFVDQLHNQWPQTYLFGVNLLISGVHLMTTEVSIPSKQMKHIAQALPYMIEDQVTQDIAELHIVTGPKTESDDVPVLAIPKHLMAATRQLFKQFDLPLESILPDMLCLPLNDNQWTFLIDGKHLLIREKLLAGMAIEMDAAPIVFSSLIEHAKTPPESIRILLCQQYLNENLTQWIKTQITSCLADSEIAVEYESAASNDFTLLCDQLVQHASTKKFPHNLLQGQFAVTGRRKPNAFNWKPLAALVAFFLVLHTAFLYTQAWTLNSQAQQVEADTKSLYKSLFPRDKRIMDVKRQMEQHINDFQKGVSGETFMTLLALTGEQIREHNKDKNNTLVPKRVAYDEGQGDLRLDLTINDFKKLEEFKVRLQQADLSVETASASQDKDVVKARLKIRSERS